MIRRPPRSTLFPTRRSSDLLLARTDVVEITTSRDVAYRTPRTYRAVALANLLEGVAIPPDAVRSEEHTSELQSHLNLVCRLLLEKKKTTLVRLSAESIVMVN